MSATFDPKISFTRITSNNCLLTKVIRPDGKGGIIKEPIGHMTAGIAETVSMLFSEFGPYLRTIEPNQAIAHGLTGHNRVAIVTKGNFTGQPGTVARSLDHFIYGEGWTLGMIDCDPKPGQPALSVDELFSVVAAVWPAFAALPKWATPSTSACISDMEGNQLTDEGNGRHVYFPFRPGHMLPVLAERLFKRLWLKEHGYIFISRAGNMLVRTIFDAAVFSSERLDYSSGAKCIGCTQRLPDPVYHPGSMQDGDTPLPEPLTKAEETLYSAMVGAAKEKVKPEADRVKEARIGAEVEDLRKKRNLTREVAEAVVRQRHEGTLAPDDLILFHGDECATVAEICANPDKYHDRPCADPTEPEEGVGRAKLFVNVNGSVVINSFLHGGQVYTIRPPGYEQAEQDSQAEDKPPDAMAAIQALAALSPVEYEQRRKQAAEALCMRATVLDQLVRDARKTQDGSDLPFEETEPWPVPVEADQLLSEIARTVRRFIVCSREVANAAALWVAMTWFVDHIQVCPLAVITAPEMRCGKTQLLTVMGRLVARPLTASSITPAALFRAVEMWGPTLLIDEADAFMRDNEELRGVINSGHTRDSAFVIRTVGDDHTPTKFSTWGAKALSGIGRLATTLEDRAIILELRRKLPHEEADRLRHTEHDLFINLRSKLARFAADCGEQVRLARPPLPASLNDRAQDNWEPMLAISEVAGGDWPEIGTTAALKLSGAESATQAIGTELLADIQEVFELRNADRISTVDLINALCEDDEKPWPTFNRGNRITPRQLATKLKGYGIYSSTIRIGGSTPKGFLLDQFTEAFTRYLTPTATQNVADYTQRCGCVADSQNYMSLLYGDCCGVADKSTPQEEGILEEEI